MDINKWYDNEMLLAGLNPLFVNNSILLLNNA